MLVFQVSILSLSFYIMLYLSFSFSQYSERISNIYTPRTLQISYLMYFKHGLPMSEVTMHSTVTTIDVALSVDR